MAQSPLAIYEAHLDKGELAYQWSPEADRAVFYPRVLCPYTGSDRLEWRVSRGLGTITLADGSQTVGLVSQAHVLPGAIGISASAG